MVFCNKKYSYNSIPNTEVTILILIDGFLQYTLEELDFIDEEVTILILIDGFLQYKLL